MSRSDSFVGTAWSLDEMDLLVAGAFLSTRNAGVIFTSTAIIIVVVVVAEHDDGCFTCARFIVVYAAPALLEPLILIRSKALLVKWTLSECERAVHGS